VALKVKARLREAWRGCLRASMSVEPVRRRTRQLALAGRVPKKLWNRLPIIESEFSVALPQGRAFRYRATPGDAIGQALYWRGIEGWEFATIDVFMALVERAQHFLDIGANTGAYTLIACALHEQVRAVAYEPVPRVFQALCDNIAINHWQSRCRARQMAVSANRGQTHLHVPHTAMPSSASLAHEGFRNLRGQLITVPVTTIDDDIPANERVDLIKIDVEGFEDQVLMGMARVLRDDRPVIICECNPDGPYTLVEGILAKAGYQFYHIRDSGCERMSYIVPDPHERFRNFACVPEEDEDSHACLQAIRRQRRQRRQRR
jgi:FkbM family methyltransferase